MGTGLIIDGKPVPVSGLNIANWMDDPAMRLAPDDMRPRTTREASWVHMVVLHSTGGIPGGDDQRPQVYRDGFGPSTHAGRRIVQMWTGEDRCAGAHLIVDFDGSIYCCADLKREAAYHASQANGASVGIEIVQGKDAEMYLGQLDVVVQLVDALTCVFAIQRTIPHRYIGPVPRLMRDVDDFVGVCGHRELTNRRGAGDPGSKVINLLGLAGYEDLDLALSEDRDVWRRRQRDLNDAQKLVPALNPDGIPGPATVAALRGTGLAAGIWVERPGDAELLATLAGWRPSALQS